MLCSFVNKTTFTIELLLLTERHICEPAKKITAKIPENGIVRIEPQQKIPLKYVRKLDRETKPFGWVLNRHFSGFLATEIIITNISERAELIISEKSLPLWNKFYLLKGHFVSFGVSAKKCTAEQVAYFVTQKSDIKKLISMHLLPMLEMCIIALLALFVSIFLLACNKKDNASWEISAIPLFGLAIILIKTELIDWIVFLKKLKQNQQFTLR